MDRLLQHRDAAVTAAVSLAITAILMIAVAMTSQA
jgi:hypothetical protein